MQRRIARLPRVDGHFSVEDLGRIRKVRQGIRGRNPDAPTDRRRKDHLRGRKVPRDGVRRSSGVQLDSGSTSGLTLAEAALSRVSDAPLDAGGR